MKLTKSTLRRLIREEHQKLLEEGLMDMFKRYPGLEDAEEAGMDLKIAKDELWHDEWALFSMFVHRWFDPDAEDGKIAWDEYDDGDKDIEKAWSNWTERAKKVKLKPSVYKLLVDYGWAIAERPKNPAIIYTNPDARRVSLTDLGKETFIGLIDRITHLTKIKKDPEYRAKHRSRAEKAVGGVSIVDDGAEGAVSLT